MLGVGNRSELEPPDWATIEQRVHLPDELVEFLEKQGPMPVAPDSRRGYHRMYMRSQVVLRYHETFYAGYMLDVSRSGVGFYSPIQFLPCTPIDVWLRDGRQLQVLMKRCVRLEQSCYRCGAVFAAGS
jgi:hypothetical protein